MLLTIDMRIEGSIREKILVSYYRYRLVVQRKVSFPAIFPKEKKFFSPQLDYRSKFHSVLKKRQ